MSWDNEKTLLFIKYYEDRPVLWQKSHNYYFNTLKKEEAWKEISERLHEEVEVLKKKMESLKGSRRRERNRMSKRKGRKNVYKSKWFAWESMKFLDDFETARSSLTLKQEKLSDSEDEQQSENSEPENFGTALLENSELAGLESIDVTVGPVMPPVKQPRSPKKHPKRRRRREKAYKTLKSKRRRYKDDSGAFADYVAEKLRNMSPRIRATVQHQISSVLFNAEMNEHFVQPTQPMVQPSFPCAATYTSSPSSSSSYTSSPVHSPTDSAEPAQPQFILND